MATANISPAANLLRRSRLFSLPQAIQVQPENLSLRPHGSETATLPHPIRASIITPRSSLAKGDWGLKRPLPALSTSKKSRKPIVRVNALDTFEHVTDFESAQDHTVTLRKFQELHLPISLPSRGTYSSSLIPRHESPFEAHLDNTETSEGIDTPGVKKYRHTGPFLSGLSEAEFIAYLKKVQREKPELLRKLRERFTAQLNAEKRKQAQDNGEDLEALAPVQVTDEDFRKYLRVLRANTSALGLAVFSLLDLPSFPSVPTERMGRTYFESPGTELSSSDYVFRGPPSTHPSAGLSYTRSHALVYNHPEHGPQANPRPVEARVLRRKGRYKGQSFRSIVGVGGVALDDPDIKAFNESTPPPGLSHFEADIPGGAKYYVTPVRAAVESNGRIKLQASRSDPTTKLAYGVKDYEKPVEASRPAPHRQRQGNVPRLDRPLFPQSDPLPPPEKKTEDVARNLIRTLAQK